MMGGNSYEIKSYVQISDDERSLLDEHGLWKEPLLSVERKVMGQMHVLSITVGGLVNETIEKFKNLGDLTINTQYYIEAFEQLEVILNVVRNFGKKNIIENTEASEKRIHDEKFN